MVTECYCWFTNVFNVSKKGEKKKTFIETRKLNTLYSYTTSSQAWTFNTFLTNEKSEVYKELLAYLHTKAKVWKEALHFQLNPVWCVDTLQQQRNHDHEVALKMAQQKNRKNLCYWWHHCASVLALNFILCETNKTLI